MRCVGHRQRFRQPAGLVELDIDGIVACAQSIERRAVVYAFVGTDGKRPLDARQRLILAGGKRLLDQRDAGFRACGEISLETIGCPCLVRIDDEFGSGSGLAYRRDPLAVAVAAKLDLE